MSDGQRRLAIEQKIMELFPRRKQRHFGKERYTFIPREFDQALAPVIVIDASLMGIGAPEEVMNVWAMSDGVEIRQVLPTVWARTWDDEDLHYNLHDRDLPAPTLLTRDQTVLNFRIINGLDSAPTYSY